MSDPQLSSIERSIGELRGDVRAILRQIEQEREDAKDSRARVYERVERVEESVTITGQIAAQARDKANAVEATLANDVKPQTDRLKLIGLKGGAFLAGASLVGGFAVQPVFAAMASAVEKFFKP